MTAVSMSLAGSSRPWRPIRVSALTRAWTALTVASGAIVFTEPAPYDVLMLGLIGLLTLTGLQRYTRLLGLYLGLWLACVAGASLATMASADLARSATHAAVSLYLSLSSFVLAAFVACSPRENGTLVMRACVAAAVLAAAAGIAGYVDALPGAFELLTKFGRASGTFKDPNVLGAFLVPPTLYLAHLLLTRPAARTVLPLTGLVVLTSAVLLSFSRGAWLNLATALIVYGYLRFITAPSHRVRLRLACLGMLAILFAAAAVAAALQIDAVGSLFAERAELAQGYDLGPDGRFGGQEKASSLALVSPAGIGALQFASLYHHEDVHNVYLSMFLNAGWLGGLLYVCIIGLSIGLGLAHALRPSAHRGLFLVAYAALLGCVIEGAVIDTDHWRHFYLLLALVWGMMASPHQAQRGHLPIPHTRGMGVGFGGRTRSTRANQIPSPRLSRGKGLESFRLERSRAPLPRRHPGPLVRPCGARRNYNMHGRNWAGTQVRFRLLGQQGQIAPAPAHCTCRPAPL